MSPLHAWCPDDCDEADATTYTGLWTPSAAAAAEAERRHEDDASLALQIIHVRDAHGALHVYEVTTRWDPVFEARPVAPLPSAEASPRAAAPAT
jgi:hypothetical protein